MNILIGAIIFCFFLPHSTSQADMVPLHAVSNASLHASLLKEQDLNAAPDSGLVGFSYGFASVTLYNRPGPEVKIDQPKEAKGGLALSIISTAEAAGTPDEFMIREFERILNAVSDAGRLEELEAVLLDKDFEFLKARVKSGVSQYVILAMLQGMRPRAIRIIDSNVEEERAEFAAFGHSSFGPMWGLVRMVKEEGGWKIEDEFWHAGRSSDQRDALIAMAFKSISDVEQYIGPRPGKPAPKASSNDVVRKRALAHARVKDHRRKEAVMFVFPLNKERADPRRPAVLRHDPRARIHGLRRIKVSPEYMLPEDNYLAELFIKKGDDRFEPGEWNLVIPNKTPHEVTVSWLWSF